VFSAHPVPDAALEADIATVAQKGAGKTYANRGLVERLLDGGRRTIVLDPLNSWWGLKAMADGSPGYPVVVIGGPNGDLPLDPKGGERLGTVMAESTASVVLDVSELKRAELIAFATAFLGELYRVNRAPLWLVLEEADVFAPQSPAADGTRAMHDVVDQIARRGRARGFRLWTITQRPARLSKDVLTQTSTLLLMRLRSPQDRAAAGEWIKGHAEPGRAAEISSSLASLDVGEGYVWSPDLNLLERARFPAIRTLDTSRTPQAGEEPIAKVDWKAADYASLYELLVGGREPEGQKARKPDSPSPDFEAQLRRAERQAYDRGHADGRAEGVRAGVERVRSRALAALAAGVDAIKGLGGDEPAAPSPAPHAVPKDAGLAKALEKFGEGVVRRASELPEGEAGLSSMARRILSASRVGPGRPLLWSELGVLALASSSSGPFRGARNELLEGGWLTEDAQRQVTPLQGTPASADDVVRAWAAKLSRMAGRILLHLHQAGPATPSGVAESLGVSDSSGPYRGGWKDLRGQNLVEPDDVRGRWRLAAVLRDLPREGSR
jgi:uncharacterized protein